MLFVLTCACSTCLWLHWPHSRSFGNAVSIFKLAWKAQRSTSMNMGIRSLYIYVRTWHEKMQLVFCFCAFHVSQVHMQNWFQLAGASRVILFRLGNIWTNNVANWQLHSYSRKLDFTWKEHRCLCCSPTVLLTACLRHTVFHTICTTCCGADAWGK